MGNNEALEKMWDEHRIRPNNIRINFNKRVEAITEEDIRNEVLNMWRQHGKKRIQIRENDKKKARSTLIKRFRFEETDI